MFKRKTTTQPKDPSLVIDKLVSDVMHIHQLMKLHAFANSNIYVMDETPVWLDTVSSTTASKDGTKLKLFSVFAGAK